MNGQHQIHEGHEHRHGPGCGHTAIKHNGHVDYLHDGHLHHVAGRRRGAQLEVDRREPGGCTPSTIAAGTSRATRTDRAAATSGAARRPRRLPGRAGTCTIPTATTATTTAGSRSRADRCQGPLARRGVRDESRGRQATESSLAATDRRSAGSPPAGAPQPPMPQFSAARRQDFRT